MPVQLAESFHLHSSVSLRLVQLNSCQLLQLTQANTADGLPVIIKQTNPVEDLPRLLAPILFCKKLLPINSYAFSPCFMQSTRGQFACLQRSYVRECSMKSLSSIFQKFNNQMVDPKENLIKIVNRQRHLTVGKNISPEIKFVSNSDVSDLGS